jgi:hypothetical protein
MVTVQKRPFSEPVKKAGWSWGWVSAVDDDGRTVWVVDAHREGKQFVVRTDEKLTAFFELELPIRAAKPLRLTFASRLCLENVCAP